MEKFTKIYGILCAAGRITIVMQVVATVAMVMHYCVRIYIVEEIQQFSLKHSHLFTQDIYRKNCM